MNKISSILSLFLIIVIFGTGFLFFDSFSSSASVETSTSTDTEFLNDYLYSMANQNYYETLNDNPFSLTSDFTTEVLSKYKFKNTACDILNDMEKYEPKEVLEAASYILLNTVVTQDTLEQCVDAVIYGYENMKTDYPRNIMPGSDTIIFSDILYNMFNGGNAIQNMDIDNVDENEEVADFPTLSYDKILKLYNFALELEKDYTPFSMYIASAIKYHMSYSDFYTNQFYIEILQTNPPAEEIVQLYSIYKWQAKSNYIYVSDGGMSINIRNCNSNLSSDLDLYFYIAYEDYITKSASVQNTLPTKDELPLTDELRSVCDYIIEKRNIDNDDDTEILFAYSDYNQESDLYATLMVPYTDTEKSYTYGVIAFEYDDITMSYRQIPVVNDKLGIECTTEELHTFEEEHTALYYSRTDEIMFIEYSKEN